MSLFAKLCASSIRLFCSHSQQTRPETLTEQTTEKIFFYLTTMVSNHHINSTLLHHHNNQSNKSNFSLSWILKWYFCKLTIISVVALSFIVQEPCKNKQYSLRILSSFYEESFFIINSAKESGKCPSSPSPNSTFCCKRKVSVRGGRVGSFRF